MNLTSSLLNIYLLLITNKALINILNTALTESCSPGGSFLEIEFIPLTTDCHNALWKASYQFTLPAAGGERPSTNHTVITNIE